VSRPPRTNERVALAVATLASFLTPFMGSATNVALPAIGREMGLDAVALSWVATAYLLSAAVFLVPFGKVADIQGRKRVFVGGLLVYTATSLLCALAPSFPLLLAGRVAQGLGGGMIFGTGVALLTSIFPPGKRGLALGVNVAAVYLGLSLGPPLGGLMTQQLGWRSVFLCNVPLGALASAMAAWGLVGEWRESPGDRFDVPGAMLYGAGLCALMYGLGRLPSAAGGALVGSGIVALVAFVARERRAASPLLDLALFAGNRVFAFSNLAALINYAATFAVGFLLSLYFQSVRGLSPQAAGGLLTAQPLVMAVVSPFAGRLSDRVDPRVVASLGMGLIAIGLGLLTLVGPATPVACVVACLLVLGAGFGLFSSPNTNAVMASVEPRSYGVASAVLATMRLVGQMLSMGVASLVLEVFVGREAVRPDRAGGFVTGMRAAFALYALLCVAGVFASLARGRAGGTNGATGPRRSRPGAPASTPRPSGRSRPATAVWASNRGPRAPSSRRRRGGRGRPRAAGPSRTALRGRSRGGQPRSPRAPSNRCRCRD
jgi:EmrB/QacA subfamily drug resistance transporter